MANSKAKTPSIHRCACGNRAAFFAHGYWICERCRKIELMRETENRRESHLAYYRRKQQKNNDKIALDISSQSVKVRAIERLERFLVSKLNQNKTDEN